MSKALSQRAAAAAAALCLAFAFSAQARAEVTQEGNLRVSFTGGIVPNVLPRVGAAPVTFILGGDIATTDGVPPPQLRTISLAINRNGRLDYRGLPACHYHQIQPASSVEALEACRGAAIGKGAFGAHVVLPEQSPFPSQGRVIAFNGTLHGRHVIFVHVYGTRPLPQSQVLVFELGKTTGPYRTTLTASLPQVAAEWGYVSRLVLTIRRTFIFKGRRRSYLAAGCPAPKGFPGAVFPFAKASFGFEDGRVLGAAMTRSCGVASE